MVLIKTHLFVLLWMKSLTGCIDFVQLVSERNTYQIIIHLITTVCCKRDQLYRNLHYLPEKVWHTAYRVQAIAKYAEKSVQDQKVQCLSSHISLVFSADVFHEHTIPCAIIFFFFYLLVTCKVRIIPTLVVFTLFPEEQLHPLRSGRTLHSSPSRHGCMWHHHFCSTIEATRENKYICMLLKWTVYYVIMLQHLFFRKMLEIHWLAASLWFSASSEPSQEIRSQFAQGAICFKTNLCTLFHFVLFFNLLHFRN